MRLIDGDALMETIRAHDYPLRAHFNSTDNGMFTLGIQQAVDEQPTVDAVPVVRCRECKHYEEAKLNVITSHDKVCAYAIDHRFYREPDDFCSKGERKGGDE